jgi:mono/diheme cytochrome c family protein
MQRALFLILALSSFGCAPKDTASTTDSGGGGEAPNGAALFSSSCAGCHGVNGEGVGSSPSLVERVPELTDSDLATVIDEGTGSMPSVGLSSDEVDAVFLYVRAQFGQEGGA